MWNWKTLLATGMGCFNTSIEGDVYLIECHKEGRLFTKIGKGCFKRINLLLPILKRNGFHPTRIAVVSTLNSELAEKLLHKHFEGYRLHQPVKRGSQRKAKAFDGYTEIFSVSIEDCIKASNGYDVPPTHFGLSNKWNNPCVVGARRRWTNMELIPVSDISLESVSRLTLLVKPSWREAETNKLIKENQWDYPTKFHIELPATLSNSYSNHYLPLHHLFSQWIMPLNAAVKIANECPMDGITLEDVLREITKKGTQESFYPCCEVKYKDMYLIDNELKS